MTFAIGLGHDEGVREVGASADLVLDDEGPGDLGPCRNVDEHAGELARRMELAELLGAERRLLGEEETAEELPVLSLGSVPEAGHDDALGEVGRKGKRGSRRRGNGRLARSLHLG